MDDRSGQDPLRVGDAARLAHVSVRTLHHYDRIGLLRRPRGPGRAIGCTRRRTSSDCRRCCCIRSSGSGSAIRALLAEPDSTGARPFARSARSSRAGQTASTAVLALVDRTLRAMEEGIPMDAATCSTSLALRSGAARGTRQWSAGARREAFQESARRTHRYTRDDWVRFKADSDVVTHGRGAHGRGR